MSNLVAGARRVLAGLVLSVCVADAPAQSVVELPVPGFPSAISADGSVIVGSRYVNGESFRAYRIDANGVEYLNELAPVLQNVATGVSPNGANIAGADVQLVQPCGSFPTGFRVGAAWLSASPAIGMGPLPGDDDARAADVSDNGVVCGVSSRLVGDGPTCWATDRGFVWSQKDGLIEMHTAAPFTSVAPSMISADGTTVIGNGWVVFRSDARAFVWTRSEGMRPLPLADDEIADPFTVAADASDDGVHIVGHCVFPEQAYGACIWTGDGRPASLGTLPGADPEWSSSASLISGDGSVVIGVAARRSASPPGSENRRFIWDRVRGMRDFVDVLRDEFGVEIPGASTSIIDISRTGRSMVANTYIGEVRTSLLIDLGRRPACVGDFNIDGHVDSADFFTFLTEFFGETADVNEDGATTSADFFEFLAAFFNGC